MLTHDQELTATDFCLIAILWGVAIVLVVTGLAHLLGMIPVALG
jgi:hypothetical protein